MVMTVLVRGGGGGEGTGQMGRQDWELMCWGREKRE